jgi:hypothetical protein
MPAIPSHFHRALHFNTSRRRMRITTGEIRRPIQKYVCSLAGVCPGGSLRAGFDWREKLGRSGSALSNGCILPPLLHSLSATILPVQPQSSEGANRTRRTLVCTPPMGKTATSWLMTGGKAQSWRDGGGGEEQGYGSYTPHCAIRTRDTTETAHGGLETGTAWKRAGGQAMRWT